MHDPRIDQLADLLLDHSCTIKRGERVLIEAFDLPDATLVCRLIDGATKRGAVPLVSWKSNAVLRSLYQNATEESMKLAGQLESARMEKVQAYVGIRGAANSSQFADVPQERMDLYQLHWWKAVHTDVRIAKTKWVVLRYPTDSFAQAANMSTPAFEDFYFDVCTADYVAMKEAQKPLAERMRKTDRATANETKKINEVLDSDEGGRYCGEWAIGVNNRVRHPMLDTLFDEKIGGSFHLTPGNAYEIADNGNRSRIHWDLVQIQRPDYGGGEIWFDGKQIRKDGRFLPSDLQGLNEGL